MGRGVWRLRIFQDARYVRLITDCAAAISSASGTVVGTLARPGCVEISAYWKHWPCVFPQCGPGPKHLRPIVLAPWQRVLVERYPRDLLRGLLHSDGCRVTNRVHRPTKAGLKTYEYPRYHFTNASADIRGLFMEACALAGIECRPNNERNLSVARRASVRLLDEFVGPKG